MGANRGAIHLAFSLLISSFAQLKGASTDIDFPGL